MLYDEDYNMSNSNHLPMARLVAFEAHIAITLTWGINSSRGRVQAQRSIGLEVMN
jgi:hypothetical protein